MKNRPIHENLDTSFVNLSALIKYLRRRHFIGHVRVELSGYEADIHIRAENPLKVREYDHIAGRVAEGEEALQRILIRSREPGGIINVYQTVAENETARETIETVAEKIIQNDLRKPQTTTNGNGKPKTSLPANGNASHGNASHGQTEGPPKTEEKSPPPVPKPNSKLSNLPFELSNNFESKARHQNLSADERRLLLNLAGELLGTIDRALGAAKLDFRTAFRKACAEISVDYPFLSALDYRQGKIKTDERELNAKIFVGGILEALRRILDKLDAHPKFAEVYRFTTQKILALLHQRKPLYDKFSITAPLQKILGI